MIRSTRLPESDVLATLNNYVDRYPFISKLGVTAESYEDGTVQATVPYLEQYGNPPDENVEAPQELALHGGIVSSLLDTVMGFSSMAALLDDERTHGPTVSLDIDFVTAATGPLDVVAEPVRIGSSTATIRGELLDQDTGEVVAVGQGVWRVYSPQD